MFRGNSPGKGGSIKEAVGNDFFHGFGQAGLEVDWSIGLGEAVICFPGCRHRDYFGGLPSWRGTGKLK